MKKYVINIGLTILAVFSLLFLAVDAQAAEFSVKAEKAENQIGNASYFDLLVQPNQQETLYVTVTNKAKTSLSIDVSVDSARTTSEFQVDYGNKSKENSVDSSLTYNLKELLIPDKETYTVEPESSVKVPFKLTIPGGKFAGALAGGILITEKESTSENTTDSSAGLTIGNQISYEIAVLIRQNEKINITEQLKFKDFEQDDKLLQLTVQNPTENFINKLTSTIKIVDKDSGKEIVNEKKENLQMAPNTQAPLKIDFPTNLPAGEYVFSVFMKDYKDNKWSYKEDFTISKEQEKQLAEPSDKKESGFNWIYLLIGVIILLLLLVIVYLIISQRKLKKQIQHKNQKKKSSKKRK